MFLFWQKRREFGAYIILGQQYCSTYVFME